MNNEEGQRAFEEDVVLALSLFKLGYTPEEVERELEIRRRRNSTPTALTDPNNDPQFKEVTDHGAAEGTG